MSILNHFPYKTMRTGQSEVLAWVQENWNKYDVFVIVAPVAFGKSPIAYTISKWASEGLGLLTGITVPNNVLVNQVKREFNLRTMPHKNKFLSGDLYKKAKEDFKATPMKVMNNWTLLANRAYSTVQIMDEAHELVPMLQDFEGIKIWQHLDYYPENIRTAADLLMWAASLGDDPLGKKIIKLLNKNPNDYTIEHEEDIYRGKVRKCLRIYPLSPKNNAPILWPPARVRKLVLLSATINRPDIEDLGLSDRRVGYFEADSCIPPDNRPAFIDGQGSMGQHRKQATLDNVRDRIREMVEKNDTRGFIHTTYELAGTIAEGGEDYLIKHNLSNKNILLNGWLKNRKDRRAFLGCGLTTGLDLKHDICNWQAITKCQYPNLGDPAVRAKANQNPEWYAWATIKQLVQAYGRVCRAPNDYGETWILDSDFNSLYQKWSHLFPKWFREAIR